MKKFISQLRGLIKVVGSLLIILAFFAKAIYLQIRFRGSSAEALVARRQAYCTNSKFFCGLMVRIFGVELTVKGAPVADSNFLFIGNHMGFVDIFIIASLFPALFITSQEMRERPGLGEICEVAGCIFVERRSRLRIMDELGNVVEALKQGFNVVLYPEATSSDGVTILPFKKTLMMAGPQAGRPIQPGCVNYLEINGEPFSLNNRDRVCWYGDLSFFNAIWQSLTADSLKAEVTFLEPIFADADADRGEIARRAYEIVTAAFRPAVEIDDQRVKASNSF